MANCLHYSPVAQLLKNPAGHAGYTGDTSLIPGSGRPLEKETATRHNIPWKIPGTEEPGRLQFTGITELDTTEHTHTHCFITYCSKVINRFFNY